MKASDNDNTPSGILCIDKPVGVTSHDVVNRVRRLYGTKKVGHTGTLDPIASGVLVVLVGRAVKASEYLTADEKEYIAGIRLGETSDTLDSEGNVLSRYDGVIPGKEELLKALPSFTGDITQIPPMYSALKVGGKKLCDLARSGFEIEREGRRVNVKEIEYLGPGEREGEHILRVRCSKGTYIRTLCDDIGKALGCGALMYSLRRTASGKFKLGDCIAPDELERMSESRRIGMLKDTESAFGDLEAVRLPSFFERLARCGNEIYLRKIGLDLPENGIVRLYGTNGFFALGKVEIFPDGKAIRPIKQLGGIMEDRKKQYVFDAKKVKDQCVEWIVDFFEKNGRGCNAVIGISGGKDSSVAATLCVEALGKERVIGVLMPCGEQSDISASYKLVNHLVIKYYVVNVKNAVDGVLNAIPEELAISVQSKTNLPPRIRMSTLYAVSQSCNGRVVNTCNLSEDWVGYSTRYGDSVGDFSPLSGMTVNEVKQIGRLLGLPAELVDKVPSDGLCGKTDEDNLGFTYAVLDRYIREGVIDDPETKERIDRLHRINQFKLELMPAFKPEL